MAVKHPDFLKIQQRLRGLGLYPAAPYPIDDIYGRGMAAGLEALIVTEENRRGIIPAVFDKAKFLASFVNCNAPATTMEEKRSAADALGVGINYIDAIEEVEAGDDGSFDAKCRPIILPEPHWFHRQTAGRFSSTHPEISYPKWRPGNYPKSYDGRWEQLALMASLDIDAALECASWGLYQVLGIHWKAHGYGSVQEFVASMVASEGNHLKACVDFILVNGLDDELRACRPKDPESCRPFVSKYNGGGYAANKYHVKFAAAL